MNIDWKKKLTSRKFWAAVTGFVTPLLLAFGVSESVAAEITGIIMSGAALIAFIIAEGLVDSTEACAATEPVEINNKKNLGAKDEGVPLRMYDFEIVCGANDTEYPEEYEIERKATVKDQGDIGACVACTLAEVGEYLYNKEMSEAWTYGALRNDSDKNPGMYVSRALDLWKTIGQVPLSDFGVLEEMPEIRKLTNKFPHLLETARNYRIGGYASLNYANTEKKDKAIKQALMKDGVGLVAVSSDYFGESHCIMITGWNDKNNTYKIQNSWGTDWKNGGFGEIPKKEINYIYAVFNEELTLPFDDVTEDMWSYKPIKNLYLAGFINGVSDSKFEPGRQITREEVAAINDRIVRRIEEKFENVYKRLNEMR